MEHGVTKSVCVSCVCVILKLSAHYTILPAIFTAGDEFCGSLNKSHDHQAAWIVCSCCVKRSLILLHVHVSNANNATIQYRPVWIKTKHMISEDFPFALLSLNSWSILGTKQRQSRAFESLCSMKLFLEQFWILLGKSQFSVQCEYFYFWTK